MRSPKELVELVTKENPGAKDAEILAPAMADPRGATIKKELRPVLFSGPVVACSILALAIAEHFDGKYPKANAEQLVNLSMTHPRAADIPEELRPAMFDYVVSKLRPNR